MKLPSYDWVTAGERIRTRRTALGLTQEDMATQIGRSPKYYSDIERGNCGMSIETLMAISRQLNVSLDFVIYGDSQETVSDDPNAYALHALIEKYEHLPEKHKLRFIENIQLYFKIYEHT